LNGIDQETIRTYDRSVASVASLHSCIAPWRLYELARQYFRRGEFTLDVGCGIGRDSAWLLEHGFPTIGFDASWGMLLHARSLHPRISLAQDSLPHLSSIRNQSASNILCSAVIMHLADRDIPTALTTLRRILRPAGILIVSYRSAIAGGNRESGKLYSPIDDRIFAEQWTAFGGSVLVAEKAKDPERPLLWSNFVMINA
jgi:ubiquinone/menaquinone biosynthesis C-methylase UbiE